MIALGEITNDIRDVSMKIIIFGGSGYIGTKLAEQALKDQWATEIVIADIAPSKLEGKPGITYVKCDVRKPIAFESSGEIEWIFNFAAIHREPGHRDEEYFETNISGAENVCSYAERVGCKNIYFTSSISVYGPTKTETSEDAPPCPITPYGGSKYPAELIHQSWQRCGNGRRLIIVRPGVVYGPADPGNIGRMIHAIKKGYFAFPGSMSVKKSYAYVYGLIDSIYFTVASKEASLVYNYVEYPTEELGFIAGEVKRFVGSKAPLISLPTSLLLPLAAIVQFIAGDKNPIHPTRVIKAGRPTHIKPQKLMNMGFEFKYDFRKSLEHWKKVNPNDFA